MLVILIKDEDGTHKKVWHVHEPRPKLSDSDLVNTVFLQADGHELEYVHENFKKIPRTNNRSVVRWYGDHAKFIAANL